MDNENRVGRLQDKVALVTGAASGIGLATAERMLAEGASVVMLDRDRTFDWDAWAGGSACRARSTYVVGDVLDEADIARAIGIVVQRFGGLNVLFNNAGIDTRPGDLVSASAQALRHVIDNNLTSALLVSKLCMPPLIRVRGSAIINCSSAMAHRTRPGASAYTASKAGLLGLTRALALELAPYGVRVNAVLPGATETPLMWAGVPSAAIPALRSTIEAITPLGRLAFACEIASAIVFLASDDSSFMTGAELAVDGGIAIQSSLPQ